MKCSICNGKILPDSNGWSKGHNAEPVNEGRCCETCNDLIVTPTRVRYYLRMQEEK